MAYETYGIAVEGINIDSTHRRPTIFLLAGTSGAVSRSGGGTSRVEGKALVNEPNLSATRLNLFTGEVSSGGTSIQLHASGVITRALLAATRARRPDAALLAPLGISGTIADLAGAGLAVGDMLHFGEEVIYLQSSAGGSLWNVSRGYSDSPQTAHPLGENGYYAPTYWAGRAVTIFKVVLNPASGYSATGVTTVWRGYLTEAPGVGSSATTVSLKADDALSSLRKGTINRSPLRHRSDSPVVPYNGTKGTQIYCLLPPEGNQQPNSGVRKLDTPWLSEGAWKAMQVGPETMVLTRQGLTVTGFPVLGSTPFEADVPIPPPFWEVAVWSRRLDEWIQANYGGEVGVSPTISCAYPYHPLTIAAAILFSSPQSIEEDASVFDVLHPQMTLGAGFLADFSAWTSMIEATNYLEVDRLELAWDGKPEQVFAFITAKLLPAYGFALASNSAGQLTPIQVGLADVGTASAAPSVTPISGRWDWTPGILGVLDAITANIGELPWSEGRNITVSGLGARDANSSGRSTRILNPKDLTADYPTIASEAAEAFASTDLLGRLVWRYDGLPVLSCWLQADQLWSLGQTVKILRPAGLVTPVLFDRSGARVDDLWGTATLVGHITSLRYDLSRNRYEADLLLSNYSYGAYARWRAPAARIKSRPGTAQYLVEGTTSDFGLATSDALSMTVGDDVVLMSKSIAYKGGSTSRSILSIAPSGPDYLLTLSADFGVAGIAGDWIYVGSSAQYSNNAVVSGEDYPYVFMTTAATLTRPGATTGPPDEYS